MEVGRLAADDIHAHDIFACLRIDQLDEVVVAGLGLYLKRCQRFICGEECYGLMRRKLGGGVGEDEVISLPPISLMAGEQHPKRRIVLNPRPALEFFPYAGFGRAIMGKGRGDFGGEGWLDFGINIPETVALTILFVCVCYPTFQQI